MRLADEIARRFPAVTYPRQYSTFGVAANRRQVSAGFPLQPEYLTDFLPGISVAQGVQLFGQFAQDLQ